MCIVLLGAGISLFNPIVWGKLMASLFNKSIFQIEVQIFYLTILFLIQSIINYFQAYLSTTINIDIDNHIKDLLYSKIMNLTVKAFDETSVGEFTSRIHNDVSSLSNIITNQFLNIVIDFIKIIVISIIVFKINMYLGLLVLGVFPFSYLIFKYFGSILKKYNQQLKKLYDDYFNKLQQTFLGIKDIKSLGLKDVTNSLFSSTLLRLKKNLKQQSVISQLSHLVNNIVSFIFNTLIIILGAYQIVKGDLSIELFIAFISYSSQLTNSLFNITKISSTIQQAVVSVDRIFEILENVNYEDEVFGNIELNKIDGRIVFKNVCFSYKNDEMILKNINIDIEPNQKFAIVGKSGAGKTTLFNLIIRFYKPTSGKILIDNIDTNKLNEISLRDNIAIVRQDPFLFDGTIKENIQITNAKATSEEVIEACKLANIHEYIMSLPNKYDTYIHENGTNLSIGQKQRLAIARAILKKTKIILFDESTSALDNESQFYIKKSLNKLKMSHTIVVIAHRLLTINDSDKIMLIDNGAVSGFGTHSELISNNLIYIGLFQNEIELATEYNYSELSAK
jgi:ATP-binding cassette subfamily B protein